MKTKSKNPLTVAIHTIASRTTTATIILFLLFCFLNTGAVAQVQVGTGTVTGQSLPIEPYYGYSYSQVIYLASEISASGDITELQWYFAGSSLSNSNDWTIYIGHTTKTEFTSSSDWVPVGSMTQVYSGTFTDPGTSGWITFDITDWTYNGTDNIVVAVDENAAGYDYSDDDFHCTAKTNHRGLEYHDDYSNPDPSSPPSGSLKSYIANIIFGGITQSCPPPSAQTESNITSTSADLDWTTGGATTWDIEWGPAGFTQGSGTMVTGITSKPYTLSGLSSNTTYDWYVRDDCGGGDQSIWEGPSTFTTACVAFTLPWYESFEGMTTVGDGILPDCMDEENVWTTADSPQSWNRQARVGTHYIFTNWSADDWLFSPPMDLTADTSYDFSFWYITDGLPGWTTIEAKYGTGQTSADMTGAIGYPVSGANNTTYVEYRGSFTPATSGTYYMGIHVVSTSSPWYITFDDLRCEKTPTCPAPTTQSVNNITNSSADLDWTSGGATTWDIEWGLTGFTQGSGTMITGITSKPYTLSGLSDNTTYDWYVRDDCGGGDLSTWMGPNTFSTDCNPFTVTFSENFDGVTAPDTPDCWSPLVNSTSIYASVETYTLASPNSSPNHIRFYNSGDATATLILVTPQLSDLTSQSNQIRFYAKHGSNSADLIVGTMTDPSDESSFTNFTTINLSGTYTEYTVMFDASYTGSDEYIAFKHGLGDTYLSIYLDDFVYEPIPSCIPPDDLTESSITPTSVDLDWGSGSASTWDLEWGPAGFTQGSGTMVTGLTSKPYTLAGLSAFTTYDWYVRGDCGGGDLSTWTGPATFTTACNATAIPYKEDFNAVTPPGFPLCMKVEDANTDEKEWHGVNGGFSTPNSALMMYNPSVAMDDWFFTQGLQLSGGVTYEVSFVYKCSHPYYPEKLAVDWGNYASSTAMSGSPVFDDNIVDNVGWNAGTGTFTPATTGTYYVGFHGYSDAGMQYLYVDDVKVQETVAATTWTGATGNDWDTPGNWSSGLPSSGTNVTIPAGLTNYPTLSSGTSISTLLIESDATGDASILNDNMLFLPGPATVQRYITGGVWHDFSASAQNQTLNSVYFNHNPDVWLRTYNEPDNTHTYLTSLSDPMPPGAGYEIWVEAGNNVTVNFTGPLQTGDVGLTTTSTPAISYSGPDPLGYNLIGNPFASPVDLNLGTWSTTNVSTSYWVWNPGATTYYDWNTSGGGSGSLTGGIVPMGQGFFIQTTGASPAITIPAGSRVHSSQAYYKYSPAGENSENGLISMSLRALMDNGYDEMNITFSGEAEEEFDTYDTRKMFAFEGNAAQIYSEQNGEQLSINGLLLLTQEGYEVKAGYKAGTDGTQWIEANLDDLPETEVLLEDLFTGNVQSLNEEPLYQFESSAGDEPLRFILHFNPAITGIDDQPDATGVKVYAFDGAVYIRSKGKAAKEKKNVWIYDIFGRTVLETTVYPSTLNRIPLKQKNAFLIVRTVSQSGITTTKLFVK